MNENQGIKNGSAECCYCGALFCVECQGGYLTRQEKREREMARKVHVGEAEYYLHSFDEVSGEVIFGIKSNDQGLPPATNNQRGLDA